MAKRSKWQGQYELLLIHVSGWRQGYNKKYDTKMVEQRLRSGGSRPAWTRRPVWGRQKSLLGRCQSIGGLCRSTQFRGCHVIASAKRAVKIGQIPEPDIERYSADLLVGMEGIRQQPVRADKALGEHILSEGRALAFEQ